MQSLHLLVVGMWTGLVGAEVLLEWTCRDGAAARTAARVHYWLDVLLEAPLVLAVCVTGAVLLLRGAWPPSETLWVKLIAGAIPSPPAPARFKVRPVVPGGRAAPNPDRRLHPRRATPAGVRT